MLGDVQGFETAVKNVIKFVTFNVNTRPQVFEVTIRVLGGLLSAHIFASRSDQPFYLPWYKDELLHMAHDLGNRLLPAFSTPTGIPYAKVSVLGIMDSSVLITTPGSYETRRTQRRRLRNLYVTSQSTGNSNQRITQAPLEPVIDPFLVTWPTLRFFPRFSHLRIRNAESPHR